MEDASTYKSEMMTIERKDPNRPPRADAARNQEKILEAAKAVFAEQGTQVNLDEVARRAKVGIATLYRNYPNREALIEAVYRREVDQLALAAPQLLSRLSAADALHRWLHLAVDHVATKKGLASALGAIVNNSSGVYAYSVGKLTEGITLLVTAAVNANEIAPVRDPLDLLRVLVGFYDGSDDPAVRRGAMMMIDTIIAGLRRADGP